MDHRFASFAQFWPFYVAEHSRRGTRRLHFIGTTLGLLCLIGFLVTWDWRLLLAALVLGYAFAWASHFFIERNRPATFKYPLWSFMGDWKMWGLMLLGRMDAELQEQRGGGPRTLTDHLSRYAAYHRDRRNIATHFIGIPMIVLAVAILLARPSVPVYGVPVSLASVAVVACVLFYLRLDVRFGIAMAVLYGAALWVASQVAAASLAVWLASGVGLFVLGWTLQFVGHYFEGRKPAFVDDLAGLIVGPLFVVAEAGFAFGLRKDLQAAIEARAGVL